MANRTPGQRTWCSLPIGMVQHTANQTPTREDCIQQYPFHCGGPSAHGHCLLWSFFRRPLRPPASPERVPINLQLQEDQLAMAGRLKCAKVAKKDASASLRSAHSQEPLRSCRFAEGVMLIPT